MALLFVDGFDAGDLLYKWDYTYFVNITALTRWGTGLSISMSNTQAYKSFAATTRVTVGLAVRKDFGGSSWYFYLSGDKGTTQHLSVSLNGAGQVELRRGNAAGTLLGTSTTVIPAFTWTYVEIQATIDATVGTVKLRLNGSTTDEISFTGNTKNGGTNNSIDTLNLSGFGNTPTFYYDDVYILDSNGTANTTFLGDIKVNTLVPTGDGAFSQLTGQDADSVNNWQNVDELPFSTADYNGSQTVGNRDSYTMANLAASTTNVFGVQNNRPLSKPTPSR